jgi:hypothetical protein
MLKLIIAICDEARISGSSYLLLPTSYTYDNTGEPNFLQTNNDNLYNIKDN